jgi:protein associated with RNAse G/E
VGTLPAPRRVTVRSTRYDGTFRDQFDADLLSAEDGVLTVRVYAGDPSLAPEGAVTEIATATQILFTDRWYNVNHLHEIVSPYNNLWYANIAMPATFDGREIHWIDLDLDVMRDADAGVLLKDVDIFEARTASGYYPPDIVSKVYAARDEVLALAQRGAFPFDRDHQIARPLLAT